MFFALSTCPVGWTMYTTALGRTVVGLPSSGTLEGTNVTVGSLTNEGARTITQVPIHSHNISPPATSSNGAHTHTVFNPPVTTAAAGAHTHNVVNVNSGLAGTIISLNVAPDNFSTGRTWPTDSSGNHTHTVTTNVSIDTAGAHTHTIPSFSSDSFGVSSVDVTMPYVQLLPCRKN